jgi:glutathione S-transferase
MTNLPILYSFRRCPYAMRARMAVVVSEVKVELREVVLRDKPQELVEASPKATVPVLLLPDGIVIDESLDITRWALAQNDSEDWLASDDPGLIRQNDGPFKAALDRYKYPHRFELESGAPYRDDGFAVLLQLDAKLRNSPFLSSETRGLTDIAIFPFVRQFAAIDQAWFEAQPLPALHRWLGNLLASDLFASIMHRYPRWQAGDAPTIFP